MGGYGNNVEWLIRDGITYGRTTLYENAALLYHPPLTPSCLFYSLGLKLIVIWPSTVYGLIRYGIRYGINFTIQNIFNPFLDVYYGAVLFSNTIYWDILQNFKTTYSSCLNNYTQSLTYF